MLHWFWILIINGESFTHGGSGCEFKGDKERRPAYLTQKQGTIQKTPRYIWTRINSDQRTTNIVWTRRNHRRLECSRCQHHQRPKHDVTNYDAEIITFVFNKIEKIRREYISIKQMFRLSGVRRGTKREETSWAMFQKSTVRTRPSSLQNKRDLRNCGDNYCAAEWARSEGKTATRIMLCKKSHPTTKRKCEYATRWKIPTKQSTLVAPRRTSAPVATGRSTRQVAGNLFTSTEPRLKGSLRKPRAEVSVRKRLLKL